MMLLHPIYPVLELLRKGTLRKIREIVANKIGISGKQLENLERGKNKPRSSTIQRFLKVLVLCPSWVCVNSFSFRRLARMNEWTAFLNGLSLSGDPREFFPLLFEDLYSLSVIDGKLEQLHKKPDEFKKELSRIQICCISDKLTECSLNFDSRRELRGSLFELRMHVSIYLIACLESEISHILDDDSLDGQWQTFFAPGADCRRIFVDRLKNRANISSNNELADLYSQEFSVDLDSGMRQVRRVRAKDHEICSDGLGFLAGLSENDYLLTYIEYYISRYAQFHQDVPSKLKAEGVEKELIFGDCVDFYKVCYRESLERKLINKRDAA